MSQFVTFFFLFFFSVLGKAKEKRRAAGSIITVLSQGGKGIYVMRLPTLNLPMKCYVRYQCTVCACGVRVHAVHNMCAIGHG